jgi:hypothetical protein
MRDDGGRWNRRPYGFTVTEGFGDAAPTFGAQGQWSGLTPGDVVEEDEHEPTGGVGDHTKADPHGPQSRVRSQNEPLSPNRDDEQDKQVIRPWLGSMSGAPNLFRAWWHGPATRPLRFPSMLHPQRDFGYGAPRLEFDGRHAEVYAAKLGPSLEGGMKPSRRFPMNTYRYVPRRWDANLYDPNTRPPEGE